MYAIAFNVEGLPKMPNELLHAHWRVSQRNARDWKLLIRSQVGRATPPAPLNGALVNFVRRSASQPDYDGLVGSFKPVLDGLVEAHVLEDDTMDQVVAHYRWEHAPRGKGSIGVSVSER